MEKINYQKKTDEIIESFNGQRKSLLLHSCCGPCSSYVLEYLGKFFDITLLYYNPNIYPDEEYEKRLAEQKRLVNEAFPSVKVLTVPFKSDEFYEAVKGNENLGEGSERCYRCYEFRLMKTAQLSLGKYDYFTTTLSISPYKKANWINELGYSIQAKIGANYLPADFKKKNGYKRSIELCKVYNIYRQEYCGCVFSLEEAKKQAEKSST